MQRRANSMVEVFGLPIAFVIGRNGRIADKHIGATDISVFEKEIVTLLARKLVRR